MKTIDFSRFNLYTVVRDLIINIWIIVLALITGFVGTVWYLNYLRKENYVSSMIVSINLSGYTTEATALSLARTVEIAKTLDDVFQSSALTNVVEKEMGEPLTAKISASQLGETNLVTISATDSTPQKAYETLVSVGENYHKVTDNVFTNVMIRTVKNPEMPSEPAGTLSPTTAGVLVGILAGLIVTGIIVLISFLRNTVKSTSDVENELDTKLFGTVNRVKKFNQKLPESKQRVLITNPLVGFDFVNSFRKIAVKLESLHRTKNIKTLMITSVTENEGKTSIAVNTALALAQSGNHVLLMDCDLKNPSVRHFFDNDETDNPNALTDCFEKAINISESIKQDTATGLSLAYNIKPATGSAEMLSSSNFAAILTELKETFDFIIVDTPPCGITVDAEIVSNVVDAAIIVVRQDVAEISDINEQIHNLDKCYLAGCVLNDIAQFGNQSSGFEDYGNYYSRQYKNS